MGTGTAIYVLTTRSIKSGVYSVSLDGSVPVEIDGYRSYDESPTQDPTCEFGWSQWGLGDGKHVLNVKTIGASPRERNSGEFELNQFVSFRNSLGDRVDCNL
jgi:hypothetical protein